MDVLSKGFNQIPFILALGAVKVTTRNYLVSLVATSETFLSAVSESESPIAERKRNSLVEEDESTDETPGFEVASSFLSRSVPLLE